MAFSEYEIVKWIVIESNSTDKSTEILQKHSRKYPVIYFETISNKNKSHRTQELALARNRYLEVFEQLQLENVSDYLVVCDLNNLNNKLDKEAVASCSKVLNWGALTSNQNGPYYDIWALRHDDWNDKDCWNRYANLIEFYPNKNLALWDSVYSKMIKISKKSNPIKVRSAFGGLAIYKTEFLNNCKYMGEDSSGSPICEHISFHDQFTKNGGSIFINPALINMNYTDHSLRKKFFNLYNLKYRIKRFISS